MSCFSEGIVGEAVAPRKSSGLRLDAHANRCEGNGMGVAMWVER